MITDPPPSLVLALQRAAHQVLTAFEDAARTMGLSPSEMNVLANLLEDREFTAAELAGASGLRPSTLTGVLDRLEAAALVLRSPHPQDRRAVVVKLTPSGRNKADQVHDAVSTYEGRIHTVLTGTGLRGFHEVIAAIGRVHSSTATGPRDAR
jgi:DNA-binding MarR family transcriptional regulator